MKKAQRQAGFTLVELLVVILCAALITLAASTTLLVGLRIHHSSTETISRQNQVRIVQTMLESMAEDGSIGTVAVTEGGNWALYKADSDTPHISYADGAIRTFDGSVLLDNIDSSSVELSGSLLTFSIEMSAAACRFSVYCRTGITPKAPGAARSIPDESAASSDLEAGRLALLSVLESQVGSTGQIIGSEQYYSQWYTGHKHNVSWPENTPWCACFLSWAAAQDSVPLASENTPCFAAVTDGVEGFSGLRTTEGRAAWNGSWAAPGTYAPLPGDFIFFDLDGDPEADHVGVVLRLDGNTVHTIEGNSNGKVELCSYELNDPRIFGYGIIAWTD